MNTTIKSIVLAAATLLPFAGSANEPTSVPNNGLYINATDYTSKVITLGFDNADKGYQISDNRWNNTVKVQQPENKFVLSLTGVWGERKNDKDYRFFNGDAYKVEYANGLFVYSKPETYSDGRTSYTVNNYYFSSSATTEIQTLDITELHETFKENAALASKLDEVQEVENPLLKAQKLISIYVQNQ
jgi:hypothetical protein